MGLIDPGTSQEMLIYHLSIASVVNPPFAFQKYQQIKDKMGITLQKSSISFILSQYFRTGNETLRNDPINSFIMTDASLFNRQTLEFLAKGYSNISIQQIIA